MKAGDVKFNFQSPATVLFENAADGEVERQRAGSLLIAAKERRERKKQPLKKNFVFFACYFHLSERVVAR